MTYEKPPGTLAEAAPLIHASWADRGRANAIDVLIGVVIVIAGDLSTMAWGFFLSGGRLVYDPTLGSFLVVMSLVYALVAIGIGYWVTSHLIATRWTTPGHWIMGLRIITTRTGRFTALRRTGLPYLLYAASTTCALIAYQRWLHGTMLADWQYDLWWWLAWGTVPGFIAILAWHGISLFLARRDPQRRTFADHIAGTEVIIIPAQQRLSFRRAFPRRKLDPGTWTLSKWMPRVLAAQALCGIMVCALNASWVMILVLLFLGLSLIPVPLGLSLILCLIDCGRFQAAVWCAAAIVAELPVFVVAIDLWRELICNRPPFVIY